jgi:hypothetical protein
MRFMIIVKATADTEAGVMPEESLFAAMDDYHQELARAGVLLDGGGLKPTSQGWRIRYQAGGSTDGQDEQRRVIDGPFTETKELVAGYTLIQVRSREEALEWTRRFPNPQGPGREAEIEVRQLYEMDDFPQTETIKRMRAMQA